MIEAYVGLIGGGKSFNAVAKMSEYLASGGVVCTNIDLMLRPWFNDRYASKLKRFEVSLESGPVDTTYLNFDSGKWWANAGGLISYLEEKYNWTLQPGQIMPLGNDEIEGALHEHLPMGSVGKPVLVVIDEAVDFFDFADSKTANRDFLTFLRYSRKLNIDIVMIAQEFTELNKRIRNQVQWVWTFKDLGIERIPVLRVKYPYPWNQNIAGCQWSGRGFGTAPEPVKIHMRNKSAKIFGCYRTEELFREVAVLKGVKTDYSADGRVIVTTGKKKMNVYERVALFAAVMFSAMGFFGKDNPPAAVAEYAPAPVISSVPAVSAVVPAIEVSYGQFRYVELNGRVRSLKVDGIEYEKGDLTPSGSVVGLGRGFVHIMDDKGNQLFLYPAARPESEFFGSAPDDL